MAYMPSAEISIFKEHVMATRIAQNTNRAQFENLIHRWESRWRLRRVLLYLPRVLMAAIGLGIIVTLIVGSLRILSPTLMVGVISGGIAALTVLLSGVFGVFGNRDIEAARQFDKLFGLQERISTALELMDGRIRTAPEIAEKQVVDAMSRAQNVDPRKHIHLEVKWLEWFGVGALTVVLVIMLGAYALFSRAGTGSAAAATQTAVEQAADAVRDITEDVATNSALTDEERSNLLESLEVTLDDLSDVPPDAENSYVALSELEADLSQLAEAIEEDVAFDSSAMAEAAEAMQNPDDSAANATIPSLSDQLEQMQQNLSEMTPEEQTQLQQQMSAASQALREAYPELAQQLEEMAASQNEAGQPNLTEEQIQELLDDLASAESNLEQRQEAAEALQQSAEQAQQSAENIAQAESQETQPSQEESQDGQPQSQQSQEDAQASQDGQPQQSQDGAGQQQGDNGQQQQGQSDTAVESENAANANANIPSDEGGQPQAGQPQNESGNAQEGGEGSGAGEGEANSRQDGLSDSNQQPGDNNADGQGETAYEEIYAPNAINAEGEGAVELETDAENAPVVEVDSRNTPDGEALVPYNQVFRNYEDAANHALENDYVPLGMQDVVRDYFSSLQPTGDR
jgi:hypothetical protein